MNTGSTSPEVLSGSHRKAMLKMKNKNSTIDVFVLTMASIVVFIILYFVAARFYPGGSDIDRLHKGFDWVNNYWCDLIAEYSKNGDLNPARPIALIAMILLFASLLFFWFRLPDFFRETRFTRIIIGYTGMIAMVILVFVFTRYHDTVILVGGSLSSIPFIGTLRELNRSNWRFLFLFGSFCMGLILLNFYIYFSGWMELLLPLIQKITLVFFLGWVFLVNLNCMLLLKNSENKKSQFTS